jgi:hypothetical protein
MNLLDGNSWEDSKALSAVSKARRDARIAQRREALRATKKAAKVAS